MDMREASAMTEASGLVNDPDGVQQVSGVSSGAAGQADRRSWPLHSPPSDGATRWADQLRKVAVRAPLQSLFVAFLLGVWVARRR
ncbi:MULTISPECIES: hypothetical protein [unclassified Bradyrhizobium]|uniref:hypothetical protein n=1 Tax=unclassified Bradyrhizobium TaxID=2631580 RepID=UPI00244C701C|nr:MULTISPECIES: hypothetical protein [unclassified Bradyrhizobium]MDH2348518.1 hypothetical protein [Bradyrhizobium sp. SSUT77]MDH2357020.1 hypothetical protein [Bradyrhizobium sp. SSUT112]